MRFDKRNEELPAGKFAGVFCRPIGHASLSGGQSERPGGRFGREGWVTTLRLFTPLPVIQTGGLLIERRAASCVLVRP